MPGFRSRPWKFGKEIRKLNFGRADSPAIVVKNHHRARRGLFLA
jgi:hypothetical protein